MVVADEESIFIDPVGISEFLMDLVVHPFESFIFSKVSGHDRAALDAMVREFLHEIFSLNA